MRLQTKLTLAFAAVLVPVAMAAVVARVLVENQYRRQFARALDEAEAEVQREYRRLGDEVAQATRRIARREDPTIGPLLMELAKGPLDDDRGDALARFAERQMGALGFDVLEILDDRGTVLAAGHFPGRVGDADPAALARVRRAPGQAQLVRERIVDQGTVTTVLAVEAAQSVQARFADGVVPRVVVIGGRRLGAAFLAALHHEAVLLAPDGALLAARADHLSAPPPAWRRYPRRLIALDDADNAVLARVEIVVPDDDLAALLRWIDLGTAVLLGGGLALALLLGWVVARRISGPVESLAAGVRAVARGELDQAVPVATRDEIGALAATFNAMTRDLATARDDLVRAERVAAWREIAQRIAHEIKNPLTPIQMAIETLQRARARQAPAFDELFTESSRTILDEVARLKHIVAEFSAFARMPAPRLGAVDVGELVEATLALYTGGASIARELGAGLPAARANRDQLVQVLLNLVENARDAAGADGNVVVRARVSGARIEIEVTDSGPGLSDEARAKLFTPYFTTKSKGTGLGLAIVHRIITDHGGEIRVDSAPGRGATFTVSLPTEATTPASP